MFAQRLGDLKSAAGERQRAETRERIAQKRIVRKIRRARRESCRRWRAARSAPNWSLSWLAKPDY